MGNAPPYGPMKYETAITFAGVTASTVVSNRKARHGSPQ